MINPHPPLSGFPLTICFIIFCCEALKHLFKKDKFNTVCNYLSLFGLILFPLVYYSGYKGMSFITTNIDQELISSHQRVAKLFMLTCTPYLVLRLAIAFEKILLGRVSSSTKEIIEAMLTCFSVAILALAIYASHLGGELVFKYGAGVSSTDLKAKDKNNITENSK